MTAKGIYGYARGHRHLEIAGIVVFFALLVFLGARTLRAVDGPLAVLGIVLSGLAGLTLSDFLSGLAHWAGDTVGTETTPILGRNFVLPFRQHHSDPKAITRHDFIETNGNNCIASLPLLLLMVAVMPRQASPLFFLCLILTFAAWFVFCSNQFHKWAHADHVPPTVAVLQRWGVLLSPGHHALHHAPPHDKYYCITVGWLNPLLTKVRFFRGCEFLIAKVAPRMLYLEERQREIARQQAAESLAAGSH